MQRTIFTSLLYFLFLTGNGQAIFSKNDIAINGYDPVAYFTQTAAVKGRDTLSYQWGNVKWLFSSQSNLDSFKENPDKYVPQFGGWCAYGVSDNHKSPTDPNAFTIVAGKLYLNYNRKVMELWRSDTTGHIKRANLNWISLKTQ
ncbi:MAG TPA: YHS domain-containing (seleno)protein [Cyclobacteriaceae bacterium]|nr:YHS domain-containing (seleno)protein [Cyclobacteriaceae bacterium]